MIPEWDNNKNLFEDYLKIFKKLNLVQIDVDTINKFDQIHAGGIATTKKIASLINFKKGDKVIELGGGIGGVSRYLAKAFDISVFNLDISFSYSLTGYKLNSLISEEIKVFFINGDAILLPFKNESFDIVWLQHINMNIADKKNLFYEIRRVLKKEGILVFHEWFLTNSDDNKVLLPLPWADNVDSNFLISFDKFLNIAMEYGFKLDFSYEDTNSALVFYKKIFDTKAYLNPIFKNRDAEKIFSNMIQMIEKKKISVYYGKLIF